MPTPAPDHIFSLAGKTALVSGGGSGLGGFMARTLSEAGARVYLVGRREAVLKTALADLQKAGGEGKMFPIDLTAKGAAVKLYQRVLDENKNDPADEGMPDIIVNAAGINPRIAADDISEEDWCHAIHLNLNVPFLLARAFVPPMRRRGWGRIINIASLQSYRAFANGMPYGAAKGGIVQLTRAMAEAWSPYGINANAIAPGFFPTDLTKAVFADKALAAKHAAQTAIGRNGEVSDLRGITLFFASPSSDYITGQTLAVDGGFTAK